jgi:hypothetical protein
MAASWSRKLVADLALACAADRTLTCELRYPADPELADGWLYVPSALEQKWAIAYRDSAIHLIRSWSGEVAAVGRARRDGDDLVIERIDLAGTSLQVFGEPLATFDWIVRAHALGQRVPLPVDRDGAAMLEGTPLSVFSLFGPIAAYAAASWSAPVPDRPLRSISDVMTAVGIDQEARVRALVAGGAALDTRSQVGGYTALHVAVTKGSVSLVRMLLDLGADPNVRGDRGESALLTAVVHRAPIELLELLASRGAEPTTSNIDAFGLIHAIAETNRVEYLPWALARGLDLEVRTRHGHTPLHIAAALGHVAALRALLDAGAGRLAKDPEGHTAHDIARAENKPAALETLDEYATG